MFKPGDKVMYWSIRRGYPNRKYDAVVKEVYHNRVRIILNDGITKLVKIENCQRGE